MNHFIFVLIAACVLLAAACAMLVKMRKKLVNQKNELEEEVSHLKERARFEKTKNEIMGEVFGNAEQKKQAIHRGDSIDRFNAANNSLRNGKNGNQN